MSDSHPMSYRLNGVAKARLQSFCDLTGMKPSEVVKAAISQFIATTLQNTDCSAQGLQNPESRAHENKRISESKDSHVNVVSRKSEIQRFFKAFWPDIKCKKFPERVTRTIKEHWDALEAWGKGPEEASRLYNEYLKNEGAKGSIPCHPNAWLAGHGFMNEEDEENDNGKIRYDVDG